MSGVFFSMADDPQQARRLAAIIVDGLRYRASDTAKTPKKTKASKRA